MVGQSFPASATRRRQDEASAPDLTSIPGIGRECCTGSMASPDETPTARNTFTTAMTVTAGISFGGALGGLMIDRSTTQISAYFLAVQDAAVFVLFVVFLVAAGLAFRTDAPSRPLGPVSRRRALQGAAIAMIIACCIIAAGASLVYRHFGLAMDEFMAEFDARILAGGKLLASVAPDWRAYVPALQPIFRLELPENAYWSSLYLPMNAAIRAVFVLLGTPASEGVVLAGVAILALFGVARRLWPDRPDAALVGVLLLVCSSQFLITAMTPYSMTAHLALNMVWLWLFLRDTRTSHAAAAGIGFVACGLHQVVFHPLFAAPFVLSLAMARRWKLASWYGAAYAVSGLFWILYWSFVLRAANVPMARSADVGIGFLVERIASIVDLSPSGVFLMGLNLMRFLAWQSPLAIPLAMVGLFAAQKRNGTLVSLVAGMALTLIAMLVLMPFQGHGWGYRYLHGFLGGLSLMAAQGWIALTDRGVGASRTAGLAFAANVAVALVVLLPWRAEQVHAFVTPYASAVAAIERTDADVVLVDPTDIWYGEDLVRNDPFLRARPKVLSLPRLDEARLTELCRHNDVRIFDRAAAQPLGIRIVESPLQLADRDRELGALMRSLGCGRPLVGNRS